MSKINLYKNVRQSLTKPDSFPFEVVERKFRGHPDSLADMVAQRFTQLYIQDTWNIFPELKDKAFPNFSADKITLSGASTQYANKKYEVIKPIDALLIGKITQKIGETQINIDSLFEKSVNDILYQSLGHKEFIPYVKRKIYAATLAGTDHNKAFYAPESTKELLQILSNESFANDTVYVVAYAPLSFTEKLSIRLDNLTYSEEFHKNFPQIGSDIKAMIRRREHEFDITLCLPVMPETVSNIRTYEKIIKNASEFLYDKILSIIKSEACYANVLLDLNINTKDTSTKKYFAVWGTSLSKGDIGAVGRGNRNQGFISGMRPSTNEALSGKNPNHFAGIIYQLVAEDIANSIFLNTGIANVVYITANNGDRLENPNSIDILVAQNVTLDYELQIREIIEKSLKNINQHKLKFINGDVFDRFMQFKLFDEQ
jgi:S-adenosylmethionine synthetase